MVVGLRFLAVGLGAAFAATLPAGAAETPKRGGTLTFMVQKWTGHDSAARRVCGILAFQY